MILTNKSGPITKHGQVNWLDSIKQAQDPEALGLLYIQNLKAEVRVLESEAKVLKQKLGLWDYGHAGSKEKCKSEQVKSISPLLNDRPKPVQLGEKPSDFAKYPTKQQFSSILAADQAFGSAAVKVEYMRELELLVEALKQQNEALRKQVADKAEKGVLSKSVVPATAKKKYEGYDLVDSKLLVNSKAFQN